MRRVGHKRSLGSLPPKQRKGIDRHILKKRWGDSTIANRYGLEPFQITSRRIRLARERGLELPSIDETRRAAARTERKRTIVELYKSGMGPTEIRDTLKVGKNIVANALKGVPKRKKIGETSDYDPDAMVRRLAANLGDRPFRDSRQDFEKTVREIAELERQIHRSKERGEPTHQTGAKRLELLGELKIRREAILLSLPPPKAKQLIGWERTLHERHIK
jgi:hypothetical protein